jgi:hypothetical protein
MGLAEDNDVIEAFPADRADQSLRKTWRSRIRNPIIAD